jgi:hypothetical protein
VVRVRSLQQNSTMSKRVIINTESVNRSGYRILNSGGKLDAYKANPVLLYGHDRYNRLPIGKLTDIKLEGGKLTGLPVFDMKDEFAAKVAQKWEDGILNAASMGINVLSVSEDPKDLVAGQSRHTVTGWELLETSIVDIPRNQDCIKLSLGGNEQEADLEAAVPLLQKQTEISSHNHITGNMEMQKIFAALSLSAQATEAEVLAAIEKVKSGRTQALLALGAQTGVITDANKKSYEALAAADYDNTLALLSVAPEAAKPEGTKPEAAKVDGAVTVEALLKAVQGANGATGRADDPNDKSKWTFDDYQKKDPTGLLKLKQEDPERYKALALNYKG